MAVEFYQRHQNSRDYFFALHTSLDCSDHHYDLQIIH